MANQYDVGAQADYDNMTKELGRPVTIYTRTYDLNYEGQEDTLTADNSTPTTEIVAMQELDSKHEMVASGQLNVGDVKFDFLHDTVANEECQVLADGKRYKVLRLTYVRGLNNNVIMYVKAFGKRLPQR